MRMWFEVLRGAGFGVAIELRGVENGDDVAHPEMRLPAAGVAEMVDVGGFDEARGIGWCGGKLALLAVVETEVPGAGFGGGDAEDHLGSVPEGGDEIGVVAGGAEFRAEIRGGGDGESYVAVGVGGGGRADGLGLGGGYEEDEKGQLRH